MAKYHAQQCYHEGCRWREKESEIERLRGRVRFLEAALLAVAGQSQAALDGYANQLNDADMRSEGKTANQGEQN